MLNMMWAIRIVQKPRSTPIGQPDVAMNRVSSDEPMTISGVAIGVKMAKLVAPRPRKL